MSDFKGGPFAIPAGRADMAVDTGLRAFMLGVYNKVALGLVVSAALAYVTSSVPAVRDLLYVVTPEGRLAGITLLGKVVQWSPLIAVLLAMFAMRNPSPKSASLYYWTIVSLFGAGLGFIGLIYTGASIASTFLITAASFGALSLSGYVTKKNLTGFGSFLMVGLFGLILASLVSMIFPMPGLVFAINVLGVFIFAGLIAYDTQRLKMSYYALQGDSDSLAVQTSFGALSLYLDFINLFLFLMRLFGSRR